MNQGNIIEYQTDNGTEIGTVIKVAKDAVTVTDIEEPNVTWRVKRDRILNVLKRSGIE